MSHQKQDELSDIIDSWLVHDEDCLASIIDDTNECNCIQLNVKQNLAKDLTAWQERTQAVAEIEARINELEYVDPSAIVTCATGGIVSEMTVKDRLATLTTQRDTLKGENV